MTKLISGLMQHVYIIFYAISSMATKTNVTDELNLCDIIEFDDSVKANKVTICDKLDKPLGGQVCLCRNTERGMSSVISQISGLAVAVVMVP